MGYTQTTKRCRQRVAEWRLPPSPGVVTDSEAAPQRTKKQHGLSRQTGTILGRARSEAHGCGSRRANEGEEPNSEAVSDTPKRGQRGRQHAKPRPSCPQPRSPQLPLGGPSTRGRTRALGRLQGRRPSVLQGGAHSEGTPRSVHSPLPGTSRTMAT